MSKSFLKNVSGSILNAVDIKHSENANTLTGFKSMLLSREESKAPVTGEFQFLVPNQLWNWEKPLAGGLPYQMVNFCNTVPNSCNPFGSFEASSEQFYDNYNVFINLLAPGFQPSEILADVKKIARKPSGQPSSEPVPPGWARVKDSAGLIRWEPLWSISMWPSEWKLDVEKNGGNSSGIRIPLESQEAFLSVDNDTTTDKTIPLLPNQVQQVEIKAKAWNRVSITPGEWYDSGIIKAAQITNGPFLGTGHQSDEFFGPGGLLTCRITEFIIAMEPELTIKAGTEFINSYGDALSKASLVQIPELGFQFNQSMKNDGKAVDVDHHSTGSEKTEYSVVSSNAGIQIIAVVVNKLSYRTRS